MRKQKITEDQLKQVKRKLPDDVCNDGFTIEVFAAIRGRWMASVNLVNGKGLILQGTFR